MNQQFILQPSFYDAGYEGMEFPTGLEGRIILMEDNDGLDCNFNPEELEAFPKVCE